MRTLLVLAALGLSSCAAPREFTFQRSPESAACVVACQEADARCVSARWWWVFNPLAALAGAPLAEHACVVKYDQCLMSCPGAFPKNPIPDA